MKKAAIILVLLVAVPGLVWAGLYVQRVRALDIDLTRARSLLGTRQGHALVQELAERYPDNAEVQFLCARSLGLFGDGTAGELRLGRAKALGWSKDEVERLYWILVAQRNFRGEAEAALQALRDRNDGDIDVLLALADGYSQIRRDMAEHLVNEILTRAPDNGAALYLRGYLYLKDPDHPDLDRASEELKRVMRQGRDYYYYPQARLLFAVCLRDKGAFPAALKLYQECRADQPNDWRAIYGVGMCERYLGNFQNALDAFQEVLRIIPGYVNARLQIAYIQEVLGKLPQALDTLRKIEAEYPEEPQMLTQTAKILAKLGDKKHAAEYQKRYDDMVKRYQDKERGKTRELGQPLGEPGMN